MQVTIDTRSGFCFGVVGAITAAEQELDLSGSLYCLGDIVHNSREVERLVKKGLKIIDRMELPKLRNCKVMIRAHGEPPDTYRIALQNNIELIDASCAVVLKLQSSIRAGYERTLKVNGQIVIFGKAGHAEVNGLVGQTGGNAIIISGENDLNKIDYGKDILLFSQTTMNTEAFEKMVSGIRERAEMAGGMSSIRFIPYNTICRQVSGRTRQLMAFATSYDVILFVSDPKSSNGTYLYDVCRQANPRSYFVSAAADIDPAWFKEAKSVGISGATSTPLWVMEEVAERAINNE
jgi:4-hydroxy-3-methylbut-2-enyl diphosphate reductase